MAMSENQIREAMRQSFSSYATKLRRASLVLGNNLAVLKNEAELAKLSPGAFGALTREEMGRSEDRMQADAAAFHPVVPFLNEVS